MDGEEWRGRERAPGWQPCRMHKFRVPSAWGTLAHAVGTCVRLQPHLTAPHAPAGPPPPRVRLACLGHARLHRVDVHARHNAELGLLSLQLRVQVSDNAGCGKA